jgi:hypothetical protein
VRFSDVRALFWIIFRLLKITVSLLSATLFSDYFTTWVADLAEAEPDIVAIDGKTPRRARARDGSPLYLISAWASRQRLVLGQKAVDAKSNDIKAIPLLPGVIRVDHGPASMAAIRHAE